MSQPPTYDPPLYDDDPDGTPDDMPVDFGTDRFRDDLDPLVHLPSRLKSKLLGHGNLRSLLPLVHTERRLCGFDLQGDEWVASPYVPFRPYAMMLWGVPDYATVSYAVMGHEQQLKASHAPVPARCFATGHSFEDVVRQFEKEGIDAPYWCDFKTLSIGHQFRLSVRTASGEPVRSLEAVLLGIAALS